MLQLTSVSSDTLMLVETLECSIHNDFAYKSIVPNWFEPLHIYSSNILNWMQICFNVQLYTEFNTWIRIKAVINCPGQFLWIINDCVQLRMKELAPQSRSMNGIIAPTERRHTGQSRLSNFPTISCATIYSFRNSFDPQNDQSTL